MRHVLIQLLHLRSVLGRCSVQMDEESGHNAPQHSPQATAHQHGENGDPAVDGGRGFSPRHSIPWINSSFFCGPPDISPS
jgi:hypothetical protein